MLSCASYDFFTGYLSIAFREWKYAKEHHASSSVTPSTPPQHDNSAEQKQQTIEPVFSDGGDVPVEEEGSDGKKGCSDCWPDFSQQKLKSHRCNPVAYSLYFLFGFAAVLLLIGILLVVQTQSLMQLEIQYDGERLGPDTDSFVYSPCKVPGPSNRDEWEQVGDGGTRARAYRNTMDSTLRCTVDITLAEKLAKSTDANTYMVFYKLTRFYQNHQVYKRGFDYAQVRPCLLLCASPLHLALLSASKRASHPNLLHPTPEPTRLSASRR